MAYPTDSPRRLPGAARAYRLTHESQILRELAQILSIPTSPRIAPTTRLLRDAVAPIDVAWASPLD